MLAQCFDTNQQQALLAAKNAGMILIAAAGNTSEDFARTPAYYDGVIGVAASDKNGKKASFSNYGREVDVMAP